MGDTNKYERDFMLPVANKRGGRIDARIFQDDDDVGDGFPGMQRITKNLISAFMGRFILEGCVYDGVDTLSAGYIMWNTTVVQIAEQTITVSNSEWLYIDITGTAAVTGTESTALANVVVYYRNGVGTGFDAAPRVNAHQMNIYKLYLANNLEVSNDITVGNDITISNDLDVDGTTNLDNTDIDGTLDVNGIVDFHSTIDLNNNDIEKVKDLDVDGNIDCEGDIDVNGTSNLDNTDVDGTLDVSGDVDFHSNLDLHNGNIDDIASIDGGGDAIRLDDNLDVNNNNINDVAAIDGGGDPIIFTDNIQMSAHDIDVNGNDIDMGNGNIDDIASIDGGGDAINVNDNLNMASTKQFLSPDEDTYHLLGRAAVGYDGSQSDQVIFSHRDHRSSTNYALRQLSTGSTNLNAVTGQSISLKINDVEELNVSASAVDIKGNNLDNVASIDNGGSPVELNDDIDLNANQISSDDGDTYHLLGRAAVGYNGSDSDNAIVSHRDNRNGTDYALKQSAGGATSLNAKSGQILDCKVNNASVMDITSSGIRLGGAGSRVDIIRDEDNMSSDDPNGLATQQSIRAFSETTANAKVSNTAFGVSWNGVGTAAPSKNAVFDEILGNMNGIRYARVVNLQNDSVGGGTATSGSSQVATLNSIYTDTSGIVNSLSSNVLNLGPGKYFMRIRMPFYDTDKSLLMFTYNSGSTILLWGAPVYANACTSMAIVSGFFETATARDYEVRYAVQTTKATEGQGLITSAGSGFMSVSHHLIVEIWYLGPYT